MSNSKFLVAVTNAHGGLSRVGSVTVANGRCQADDALKSFFPSNTKGYKQALASVRFTANCGAQSTDWSYRNFKLKTIAI